MKRTAWRVAKWLLGVGVLAAILYFNWGKLQEMLAEGGRFTLWPLGVAGLVFLCGLLITFLRWFVLVRAQELPFTLTDAVRLGFIGHFFNAFLPGSVGGDLVKAGFLASEQSRRTVAVATIVVDRVLGLIGLLFLAAIAGALFWNEASTVVDARGERPLRWIILFVWGVCCFVGLGFLAMYFVLPWTAPLSAWLERIRWAGKIAAELLRAAQMYRDKLGAVGLALALAMVGHVGFVMSYYFASLAVPPPVPDLKTQWLIVPVGMVVESVPVTPGNLGVGEFLFGQLYRLANPDDATFESKGALARMAERAVAWAVALIGLIFYLPLRATVRRLAAEQEAQVEPVAAPDPLLSPAPQAANETMS